MADINKVWVSGVVVTQPVFTKLVSRTPITTFTVQVNEKFNDRNGAPQTKSNLIRVESLGRGAELAAERVRQGGRYTVDGYLRQDFVDGHEYVRIRTFAVYPDETADTINYREGLKQAIDVLKKSRDISSALERLEALLKV